MLLKGTGFRGADSNTGEVASPLPLGSGTDTGEMRLQSDFALARDSRTACFWQGFVNQQEFMASSFKAAMAKLTILGHNRDSLIDCSDVVPAPLSAMNKPANFPLRARRTSSSLAPRTSSRASRSIVSLTVLWRARPETDGAILQSVPRRPSSLLTL